LHRQSAIQQAKLQNLQVNATVLPATNQKVVNSIILELVGGDYYNLSSSQINQLQAIANQCPMEGGDAVYEARSILRKASPNSTYNDGIICGGASPRATKEDISKYEATIYPNPASEAVKVSFNGLHPTSLELYDVMGKKVLTSKVNEHSTEEIINTSQLLGGIYQLILYEGKSKLQTIKMIVIR
jgi:Secretion system C-terminal sorting domain